MFYSFLVADPNSGLHYRLNDTRLAELSLAPRPTEWSPGRAIPSNPDPVWAESVFHAPSETISAVTSALEDLILATRDLRPPGIGALPQSRALRHLSALVSLWQEMGEALPDGLGVVRHVLELPQGRFLDPLPVVDGSLDPLAPAAMRALYFRLLTEFGSVPAPARERTGPVGSRLYALQGGLSRADLDSAPQDETVAFYGLRDPAACADFAAARARELIEAGCPAREIAVMSAGNPRQLSRAFTAQGVALSGLPETLPDRDTVGETLFHLLLAKRPPTPAMVLASVALSPLMPWAAQTGRDLSETLMGGDFRPLVLEANPDHKSLWNDIRASASSVPQLRFLMEHICERLPQGGLLRARLVPLQPLLSGEGTPDWEAIIRAVQIAPPTVGEPSRNLEGVSLWSAQESPWRPCQYLIVADFTDGLYPARPRANPLFLDSEIAHIRASTGIELRGRAEGLATSLALFDEQLQATSGSATFLIPWRDLAGGRLAASAGLSLIARAIADIEQAEELVTDLSSLPPEDWPVTCHFVPVAARPEPASEILDFPGHDLLALRRDDDGMAKPQSPSRLEALIVSPLAWLLGELDAADMSWSADALDVLTKGKIAHDVFEHVFLPNTLLPGDDALRDAVSDAYDGALTRHAGYLRSPLWEMERVGLAREISDAAISWRDHLRDLGATIIGNELWLQGVAYGIRLRGKVDAILELQDRSLVVIDHKKSGTSGRRKRMEMGWDLQAGLYREMIAHPILAEDDRMSPFAGRKVGVAYYLMNDGGLLTSCVSLVEASRARDMGDAVNEAAVARLQERLAEARVGRIVLNTTADEAFFKRQGGFTPYAITDGSPLIRAFMREAKE